MSKINQKIEELTTEILLKNDMLKVPVDIVKIANNYDINVYKGDLDKKISGAIRFFDNKFQILVNENDAKIRQRFTIAHELGHYFLHKETLEKNQLLIDAIMYKTYDTELNANKDEEKDADYFAGALLMNEILLRKIRNGNTITELAEIFDVSVSAMTVRLDVLGLL